MVGTDGERGERPCRWTPKDSFRIAPAEWVRVGDVHTEGLGGYCAILSPAFMNDAD
jgi:hypothetical protein